MVESSIARDADIVLPIFAGPEIGVASTAFTCQLAALAALAIAVAGRETRRVERRKTKKKPAPRFEIPRHIVEFLKQEAKIELLGQEVAKARDVLYLGRARFPLAMEGALKLKEISTSTPKAFSRR